MIGARRPQMTDLAKRMGLRLFFHRAELDREDAGMSPVYKDNYVRLKLIDSLHKWVKVRRGAPAHVGFNVDVQFTKPDLAPGPRKHNKTARVRFIAGQ